MRTLLARSALRVATIAVLVFMYFPLALIVVYAFNESGTSAWPPSGFSLRWVLLALENTGLRQAFLTSLAGALGATLIALVIGITGGRWPSRATGSSGARPSRSS